MEYVLRFHKQLTKSGSKKGVSLRDFILLKIRHSRDYQLCRFFSLSRLLLIAMCWKIHVIALARGLPIFLSNSYVSELIENRIFRNNIF